VAEDEAPRRNVTQERRPSRTAEDDVMDTEYET
jgi:hypothetical protein